MVSVHRGKPSHIIIGSADKIGVIFANKEERAAGLSQKVKKTRANVNDSGAASGRDVVKPLVDNVTAQPVQVNMDSPRSPSISEDNDQTQSDQPPTSAVTSEKMYTYNSGTISSSNVFHGGRVRVTVSIQTFSLTRMKSLVMMLISRNLLITCSMKTRIHHLGCLLDFYQHHLPSVLLRAGNLHLSY